MRTWALAVTILLGCESASGLLPSISPVDPPEIGREQTRCDVDEDCALWSASYKYEGCCPAQCVGKSRDAIAVNKATYYTVSGACYQHVVPRCDRRDAKYSCGEQPRSAVCVAGTCRVHERGSP